MFETGNPGSKAEIISELDRLNTQIAEFAKTIPADEFITPQAEFWSPAEHIRHLIKSVRPVAMALKIPKIMLLFKFGSTKRPGYSFDKIKEMYYSKLREGATAGRFTPSTKNQAGNPVEWQKNVIKNWVSVSQLLTTNMNSWPEKKLDTYLLPHPLLGNLTIREMLFFTLYHNKHHASRIVERREIS